VLERYEFTADDVFSQNFNLTFDLAFFDLFVAWSAGAAVVHTPTAAFSRLPRFIAVHGITVWFSVPSAIALARRMGGLAPAALPSLRWSLFCGEPLLDGDAADWQAAAPGSAVENLYGPTELTIACSAHRWTERSGAESANGVCPIGTVFDGLDHLLVDEDGQPAEESGELCVTGPQMFAGYLDPADDQGRFRHDHGQTWYRTGDWVRRSRSGELLFLGRRDQQVKIQGYRIELLEIEHMLSRIPGIRQAAVVAVGDGADRTLVAVYAGAAVSAESIAAELRRSLPVYMVPREFIAVDELPLDPRGKIDRTRLAGMATVPG
jgi:acyl-coenzyme A synthetase/AMP-(fatty) acid ligase